MHLIVRRDGILDELMVRSRTLRAFEWVDPVFETGLWYEAGQSMHFMMTIVAIEEN